MIQRASRPWELVHIGNCGSPIETPHGWLVITHGTGPMRKYVLSAILLDLENPQVMIASLKAPLVSAAPQERDGYVPNVVYSCGGMIHHDCLVLPYGFSDSATGFITMDVSELLEAMEPVT